jgi:hypothetical protein
VNIALWILRIPLALFASLASASLKSISMPMLILHDVVMLVGSSRGTRHWGPPAERSDFP